MSEVNNNNTARIIYDDIIDKYNDSSLQPQHLLNIGCNLIYGGLSNVLEIPQKEFNDDCAEFINQWIEKSEEKC